MGYMNDAAQAIIDRDAVIADLRQQVERLTALLEAGDETIRKCASTIRLLGDRATTAESQLAEATRREAKRDAVVGQQVERWTQMHYDEMQRHTETSVKLSTAEAQLAAEREAVRVLGAWKRADIAVKVASKQHYEGNSSVTYEALDEAMDRLVAAENGVDANPIAAAAVKENQHG